MRSALKIHRKSVFALNVLLTLALVYTLWSRNAIRSAYAADTAFRQFFAALQRDDRAVWTQYIPSRDLEPKKIPFYDVYEDVRHRYVDVLHPINPSFVSNVSWDCSNVDLAVRNSDFSGGQWVVIMTKSDGNWQVIGTTVSMEKWSEALRTSRTRAIPLPKATQPANSMTVENP